MSAQPPELSRTLFGYRPETVYRILADRDAMLRKTQEALDEARARVAEVEAQLEPLRQAAGESGREIIDLRNQMVVLQGELENAKLERATELSSSLTREFLRGEMSSILEEAEAASARIMERIRASTEEHAHRSERLWGEVRAGMVEFAAWRERIEPLASTLQARIEHVHARADESGRLVREALAPVTNALAELSSDLDRLAKEVTPPSIAAADLIAEATPPEPSGEGVERPASAEMQAPAEDADEEVIVVEPDEYWLGYHRLP